MKIKYTNFDGDWDSKCEFCGQPHREHQTHVGDLDGVRYIHRLPCELEKYHIRREAVKRGIVTRAILIMIDTVTYIWGLIPFKSEMKLIWSYVKNIYISLRALVFLRKSRPK